MEEFVQVEVLGLVPHPSRAFHDVARKLPYRGRSYPDTVLDRYEAHRGVGIDRYTRGGGAPAVNLKQFLLDVF